MSTDTTTTAQVIEPARLQRDREGRMIAGVCAGLARYFGVHTAIFRIGFAALALVGGAGVLLYAVAALVIPVEGAEDSIAEEFLRRHRDRPALLVGLALLGLLGIVLLSSSGEGAWFWPVAGPLWLVVLLGGALFVLSRVSSRDRERAAVGSPAAATSPARQSLFLPGLGLLLAAAGVAALVELLDVVDVSLAVALAVGLVLTGGLVAAGAVVGRRTAGLAVLGILLGLMLAATSIAGVDGGRVGESTVRPLTAGELEDEYRVSVGRLEVDLRDLELPLGETRIVARVAFGELVVRVPDGVPVDASGDVAAGDLRVLGRAEDGLDVHERAVDDGFEDAPRRLVVDVEVGFGELVVRRGFGS